MKKIIFFVLISLMIIFLITACPSKKVFYLNIEIELTEGASGTVHPSVGEYSYYKGMKEKIKAIPSEDSVFVKWIIDGIEETNPSTTITINKNLTATAYFEREKPKYSLMILNPYGKGKTSPSAGIYEYKENTEVTLIATPSEGWGFEKWQVDGEDYSINQVITLVMNEDKKVKAFFEDLPPKKFELVMHEPEGKGITLPSSGTYVYDEGTVVTLVATPQENWKFIKWEVNNEFYSSKPTAKVIMDDDKHIKAYFRILPKEYTLTMLEPSGEGETYPTSPGTYNYIEDTEVTLTSTPAEGWKFVKWQVDGVDYSTEPSTTLVMNSDKQIKAFFEEIPEEYTLTMLEPNGEGITYPTSPGTYTYLEGTEVTLTSTPAEGWKFVKWQVDGVDYSTEPSTTLVMNSDKQIKAFFEEIPEEYTLTMLEPSGEGAIDPDVGDHVYTEGTEVTLSATPDIGWEFIRWEVDGIGYSTDLTTTLIMNSDKEVKAFFEEVPPEEYTLTMLEPSGEGETYPTSPGTYTYEEGTEVTLTSTPAEGWKFVKWQVDGVDYSTEPSTNFIMKSDKEIKAFFTSNNEGYILTTIAEGNGWIKIVPEKDTYSDGEKVKLEAIPENCSRFDKWHGDILSESKVIELIVDDDKIIYAVFKKKDNPPSIEITSPQPVPEYINDLSQEFEFDFYSNNEDVNISDVSAEVSFGKALLNYQVNKGSGHGTLVWNFGTDETINCQSYDGTITVEDTCENISSKLIHVKVDNVSPELEFEVGVFKIVENYIETNLSWIATDSCFNKVSFDVNNGTLAKSHSFSCEGSNIWKIPLNELNGSDLVVTVTAYDKAGNTKPVSKTITVSKLSVRVNPESAGTVSPAAGDYYYPSSTGIDISATPGPEYAFDKWTTTAGSFEDANSPETVFVMPDQNATITANFVIIWKGFSENVSKIEQVSNVKVDKPANVEEGDMIVVIIHTQNRINNDWVNDPLSSQGFSLIGHSVDESSYERPTVTTAYKIAGNNEPEVYSFKISEEMHWYIAAICINKGAGIGEVITKNSGENSVESITFDSITAANKSLIIAAITQRRSIESDYNARSFVAPQGMTERYSNYSIGTDKPSASGASQFLKAGETINSPTYSWDYTGRAAGIMFEITFGD